jgi:cyclase
MLARRVIPCLDIEAGRVVKGVQFQGLRDEGDPVELAVRYDLAGADELALLDVRASDQGRGILLEVVRNVAAKVSIPFTVGGGLRSLDDLRAVLLAGADKVSIGTAAVRDPQVVAAAANTLGCQCVVVSLDIRRAASGQRSPGSGWEITTHGGRQSTGLDAIDFAREMARLGAGELLLNAMDADGTRQGFANDLNRAIADAVGIPVIASGGAGTPQDFVDAVRRGHADAVLAASVFHRGTLTIAEVKRAMAEAGLPVRREDA